MKKGFTLIELLIVTAIIGSLAAIVVGALTTGKNKAQDTKIKSNMANMRSQAALYFTENGDYGTEVSDDCEDGMFLDSVFTLALDGVSEANGGNTDNLNCYTSDSTGGSTSNTWAVSSPLRSDELTIWCVDSNGFAGEGEAQVVSDSAVCQ